MRDYAIGQGPLNLNNLLCEVCLNLYWSISKRIKQQPAPVDESSLNYEILNVCTP